jgi:hypothetical protein
MNLSGLFGLGPNPFGSPPSAYDCGIQYSWYWWVIALQFACIVLAISGSTNKSLPSIYGIVTTLWSIYCYAFVIQTYQYQKAGESTTAWGPSYTINAAGAIAISTANFLFLIAHGLDDAINEPVVKEETKNPTSAGCQV